jgi:mannosyltransferase OCH1-like enzyme
MKYYSLLIGLVIILVMIGLGCYTISPEHFLDASGNNVPRIIHQVAAYMSHLPKIWISCQKSWKKQFPNPHFTYKLWDDSDLKGLIIDKEPQLLEIYNGYHRNICRIDLARYVILYHYGGIYADMDFECLKNFYHNLKPNTAYIVASPKTHPSNNALMCSNVKNPFWLKVISECERQYKKYGHIKQYNPIKLTGPNVLLQVLHNNNNVADILPKIKYNPDLNTENWYDIKNIYTRHHFTGTWTLKNQNTYHHFLNQTS